MIEVPATFVPTHPTGGLDGYPAVDLFGAPRDLVRVLFWGEVVRRSGRAPSAGGRPGGAYGRSLYIRNSQARVERYLTHLDELAVDVGDYVWPGRVIASVCDSAVSGKPGTTHVHVGMRRW